MKIKQKSTLWSTICLAILTLVVLSGCSGKDDDPVAVSGVELDKPTLTLAVGGTETLTATVLPENADNKTVTWTSSAPAIATVENTGKVTAVAVGATTITATAIGGKSATCTVTVSAATVEVTSVTLNKPTLTLPVDGNATLTATVLPENADNKTVTWTSSKPEFATVDNGKVTAMAAGEATITATAGGKSATCTVTVDAPGLPTGDNFTPGGGGGDWQVSY